MFNEVIIAAAGGGKTTRIVRRAVAAGAHQVALVTYTTNNVQEIRRKLYEERAALPPHVEIWSWYRFLLHEMARPYQRSLVDRRIDGLHWVDGRSAQYVKKVDTLRYYLSDGRRVYSDKISQFVIECDKASGGAVIGRLSERFQTIFVDEIQDMAGYDLDLLELILRSSIKLVLVGDHRQATYSTNNAAKNKAYAGANIIKKFREWEKKGLVNLTYDTETHRCHQQIADLGDAFFPGEPRTVSRNLQVTGHDGVYLVSSTKVSAYVEQYRPQVLRLNRTTPSRDYPAMNFGASKGLTFDRVLIFPHKSGLKWLSSGNFKYVQKSAAELYVGITRARHSVAFVFDGEAKVPGMVRFK